MKLLRSLAVGTAAVLGATLLVGPHPAAAQKTLKLAHLNKADPFDNATGAMAAVFKNLVESGTNGEITVQIFPDGQLGKDSEVLQQVQAGVAQSSIATVGGIASVYPMISVLDVPFAFPDIAATYEVFDGPFGERLAQDIAAKTGFHVLGFGDSGGFYQLTNSERQVRTPDDMQGLKIRTQALETHEQLVSALGGQPVSVAWAEVYTSLQTGVADGQMNPVPIIVFANLNEVQEYLSLTNHLFTPYVWVMNKGFYDSLSEEEQRVVDSAAKSAIVAGRGISRIIEASERGLPALQEEMEVYAPTPEELAAFREQAQPAVIEHIKQRFGGEGEDLLNGFLEAIEEAAGEGAGTGEAGSEG